MKRQLNVNGILFVVLAAFGMGIYLAVPEREEPLDENCEPSSFKARVHASLGGIEYWNRRLADERMWRDIMAADYEKHLRDNPPGKPYPVEKLTDQEAAFMEKMSPGSAKTLELANQKVAEQMTKVVPMVGEAVRSVAIHHGKCVSLIEARLRQGTK